jgi:membrane carboxypeptidase/penicillin-binding protein
MKRAHQYREYRGVQAFQPPDGITTVDIDPLTGQLATAACPKPRAEVFVAGTQPVEFCRLHGGSGQRTQIAAWDDAPVEQQGVEPSESQARGSARVARRSRPEEPQAPASPKPEQEAPKRGFLDRIRAIFR